MRNFIFIFAFSLIGSFGFSQELQPNQVPQNIKDRLQAKFPQTIEIPVAWSKEKGNYKASITIMDSPAFMVLDSLGRTVRIERKIHETYLPKKAKDKLKALDPNYQVVSVMQITDGKEKVTYKTVAKISTNFTFNSDGNTIADTN
ncbi:MAG: hypothetical protein Q8M08_09285 [Bacteroidales bacterium]|nr:hypothetical protein [Bacteroidales bacterium]